MQHPPSQEEDALFDLQGLRNYKVLTEKLHAAICW